MLFFYIFSTAIFAVDISYKTCNLSQECSLDQDFDPDSFENGLTALWAQKMAGVDLSKKFIKSIAETRKINVGVWDDGFDIQSIPGVSREFLNYSLDKTNHLIVHGPSDSEVDYHGTSVANLISGFNDISGGVNSQISVLQSMSGSKSFKDMAIALTKVPKSIFPEIINISHDNKVSTQATKNSLVLSSLVKSTLFICASGNYYPSRAEGVEENHCLQVGSVNYDGKISTFSMEGAAVKVYAPSDNSGLSVKQGKKSTFGGTSGASPLVAGVVSDLLSVFSKDNSFNKNQILTLLKNTVISTDQLKMTGDGAGIINPLKLVKVAHRLRGKAYGLDDPLLYDFSEESLQLELRASLLLNSSSCDKIKAGYNLLREAFYLAGDDRRQQIAIDLSKINIQNGAFKNAQYFESFLSNQIDYKKELLSLDPYDQEGFVRYWFDMEQPSDSELSEVFSKLSPEGKIGVLKELALVKRGLHFFDKSKSSSEKWHGTFPIKDYADYLFNRYFENSISAK